MNASAAIADRYCDEPSAGRLSPRSLDILFQVCLGSSGLHVPRHCPLTTRGRPQTWRSLSFAPWTSLRDCAISPRTPMNHAGQPLHTKGILELVTFCNSGFPDESGLRLYDIPNGFGWRPEKGARIFSAWLRIFLHMHHMMTLVHP